MTRMDRRALFTSGAAAALLAATGLSAAPVRGGHLRAALSGASRDDTWMTAGEGLFMQAAQASVFETLTEIAPDGTLRGELATGWSTQDAGREWSFDLRPDVMFHDGQALMGQDVVRSLSVDGVVEAVGDLAIRIRLNQADMNLPFALADIGQSIRPADADRAAAGVGTGLYRVEKFEAGRQFVGLRVDQHWRDGSAGWFDRVEFAHFSSDDVRADALARGLVDVADVTTVDGMAADFRKMPNDRDVWQIASSRVAVPGTVGRAKPLDNLRFAERWWMA